MDELRIRNLKLFTVISSVWAIVTGLLGPFFVLYVSKITGGMEELGIAFTIFLFVQSATTYIVGHFSDKLGRKFFLLLTAYADSIIIFLYTVITDINHLYILQVLAGITNGIVGTVRMIILGDLTTKAKRGRNVGRYNAIIKFSAGIGLLLGGYIVNIYGFKSTFYIASILIASSSIPLFFMKEDIDGK